MTHCSYLLRSRGALHITSRKNLTKLKFFFSTHWLPPTMSRPGVSRLKSAFDDDEFERSAHDLLGDGASADLPGTRMQLPPGPLLGNNTPGPSRGGVGLHRT